MNKIISNAAQKLVIASFVLLSLYSCKKEPLEDSISGKWDMAYYTWIDTTDLGREEINKDMTGIARFEDLEIWRESREINKLLFKQFTENKNFGFRDQILRVSLSVMNNIAEGFERGSDKEFQRFLKIAKGSAGEVRSLLYVAVDLKYLSENELGELLEILVRLSSRISKLITYLNRNVKPPEN